MRKYVSFFRMKFLAGLQYRAAALAGIATQFGFGFLYVLFFSAFYRSGGSGGNPAAFPMEFSQLVSYVWLQQAFVILLFIFFDLELFEAVTTGQIAYELCRPLDIYKMWFIRLAADRISKALLRCLPILLIAFFLPAPYTMGLPESPAAFALFLLSMVFAFLLVNAFCMLIYISVFFTVSPAGMRAISMAVAHFLMGAVIPLPFFPPAVLRVLEFLPFAYMGNTPLRIYSGSITGDDALFSIAMQLVWLAALFAAGELWMRRAVRKVVVHGG